jgi:hypothetical protein
METIAYTRGEEDDHDWAAPAGSYSEKDLGVAFCKEVMQINFSKAFTIGTRLAQDSTRWPAAWREGLKKRARVGIDLVPLRLLKQHYQILRTICNGADPGAKVDVPRESLRTLYSLAQRQHCMGLCDGEPAGCTVVRNVGEDSRVTLDSALQELAIIFEPAECLGSDASRKSQCAKTSPSCL